MEIFRELDLRDDGFISVDDVVDVFNCIDATFALNLASVADLNSTAASLGLWLSSTQQNNLVALDDLSEFVSDSVSFSASRSVTCHLGRLLEIHGAANKLSGGGEEQLRSLFNENKVLTISDFKRGLAAIRPKLAVEEFDALVTDLVLGGGDIKDESRTMVSVDRFASLAFPEASKDHRQLQKAVYSHFALDQKLLKNFMLVCGDVDYDNTGVLEWKTFLRVLDNSTLLLTTGQSAMLCSLLTRDIATSAGQGQIRYKEILRIAKGETLSMPQFGKARSGGVGGGVGAGGVAATPDVARKKLVDAAKPKRLLGSGKKGAAGSESQSDSGGSGTSTPVGSSLGGKDRGPRFSKTMVELGSAEQGSNRRLSVTFKEGSPEQSSN